MKEYIDYSYFKLLYINGKLNTRFYISGSVFNIFAKLLLKIKVVDIQIYLYCL